VKRTAIIAALGLAWPTALPAQVQSMQRDADDSVRNEIEIALNHGLAWLKEHQNPDGLWSDAKEPAPTALVLTAFLREPEGRYRTNPRPSFLEKAATALRTSVQPDGSFLGEARGTPATSICLPALLINGDPADERRARMARDFLWRQINSGRADAKTGLREGRPSLTETAAALEALRAWAAAHLHRKPASGKTPNWAGTMAFARRCQILGAKAGNARGGFVDVPEYQEAGRPTGAVTCSGLLAFIYMDAKREDPQVEAALDWIKKHYTLAENPGLGAAGVYHYLLLLAKGLTAAGVTDLEIDGRKIDWARAEALKLLDLQNSDGSWINRVSNAEHEGDPVTATSISIMALEILHYRL
jgi:squalene-hopene/tetraprenyl-beta-curcumene cyclase